MKVIFCPVNGWDCPYFDANGCCMMYPDTDPIKECDDFATFWEEGEDYICDTDEDYEPDEPDVDETFYDPYMGCDFYE